MREAQRRLAQAHIQNAIRRAEDQGAKIEGNPRYSY
jgi:hypothetical protein